MPNKLEALNDAQCIEWLCPEIRTNVGARTNECSFRIKWGNMAHRPTFWPENLVPWHLVNSPTNGGNTKHGIAFGLVMKEAIKNRLAEKGLDWIVFNGEKATYELSTKRLLENGGLGQLEVVMEELRQLKVVMEDWDSSSSNRGIGTVGGKGGLGQ